MTTNNQRSIILSENYRDFLPSRTLPKTTCLPSSHGVATVVMKNCDDWVFGPAFAMDM